MCFSPTASFSAAIVLSAVSVFTLKKVESKSQILFAAIPLIFGLQQFSEGMVWLSLTNPAFHKFKWSSIYVFLSFAQIIWPLWVPLSMLCLEKERFRKVLLYICSSIGFIVSCYLAYCLVHFPIDAQIREHHIYYDLKYPLGIISKGVALYLLSIIFTPFISGIKRMWVVGLVTMASFLVAKIFFSTYTISVWCLFAALISVVVWYMMPYLNEHYRYHKNLLQN
jgi:hypothetical protein